MGWTNEMPFPRMQCWPASHIWHLQCWPAGSHVAVSNLDELTSSADGPLASLTSRFPSMLWTYVYLATAAIVALIWNWLEIRSPFGCYTKLPCTGRFWLVLANLIVLCERINWNKLKQARQIELNSLKNVVNNGKNSHFGPSIIITRDSVLSLNF